MSLIKNLLQLHKKKYSHFTMPSHSQKPPYKSVIGNYYFKFDVSEINGLDNLNEPEACILDLENRFKEIYSSGFTHILTNGSTQGILTLMLATLKANDKVIVATNCHISVHNGLILTGAFPVWLYPEYDTEFGIYTSINPNSAKKIIEENPDAKCLIITTPTYDGIMSDVAKIADICKQNNVILIVDEAHGGLWNFDKTIGTPAILCGADASVQSLHKTCGAINPSALLHLSKDSQISKEKVMSATKLIATTSPSFALIANVEESINFLISQKGMSHIDKILRNIFEVCRKIKQLDNITLYSIHNDITKILIRPLNISAEEADNILYKKFKVECEVPHENALTFLCGVGTTEKKLKKLLKGLKYINKLSQKDAEISHNSNIPPIRRMNMFPRQAYYSNTEEVELINAIGKISAQIITSYPPGIPIITYGELITKEHLNFLDKKIKIRIVK